MFHALEHFLDKSIAIKVDLNCKYSFSKTAFKIIREDDYLIGMFKSKTTNPNSSSFVCHI